MSQLESAGKRMCIDHFYKSWPIGQEALCEHGEVVTIGGCNLQSIQGNSTLQFNAMYPVERRKCSFSTLFCTTNQTEPSTFNGHQSPALESPIRPYWDNSTLLVCVEGPLI
jgi:hypothetical protein